MNKIFKNAYILAITSMLYFQPAIAQEVPSELKVNTSKAQSADVLELINELEENLQWLYGSVDSMYFTLEEIPKDMDNFLKKHGYDTTKISKVPYYENPFINMHWDLYNIGVKNSLTKNTILLKTIKLKHLEQLTTKSDKDKKEITKLRNELQTMETEQGYVD